jgi:hypothetical protein
VTFWAAGFPAQFPAVLAVMLEGESEMVGEPKASEVDAMTNDENRSEKMRDFLIEGDLLQSIFERILKYHMKKWPVNITC